MRIGLRAAGAAMLAVAAVATPGPVSVHAGAAVSVRVSPQVATEPATLIIRATVEPHADNRGLQIQVESTGYCRSSFVQLDGLDAPRVTEARYPHIPVGSYEIRTTVLGPGGRPRGAASEEVMVLPRGGG